MSRVVYVGNFGPSHSTETHVRQALEANGHDVFAFQEEDIDAWRLLEAGVDSVDVVMWTRTRSLSEQIPDTLKRDVLDRCAADGVPTVGYHLDRWWGLSREHEIATDPFFRVSLLCTADGGHDKQWADAGVVHHWMPPAVSEFECVPGMADEAYASDVAFVGSWQGYHDEWWPQRSGMLDYLRARYGDRFRCWPPDGQGAVRGAPLRDLYASVKVLVGDSCLVPNRDGQPIERYWSDRIPETLGRGGFLIHPHVPGLEANFFPGVDMISYTLGDLDLMGGAIDWALENPEARSDIADHGRGRVLREHTYTVRMRQLWEVLGL